MTEEMVSETYEAILKKKKVDIQETVLLDIQFYFQDPLIQENQFGYDFVFRTQ